MKKTKIMVAVSLFVAWAIIVALMVAALIQYENEKESDDDTEDDNNQENPGQLNQNQTENLASGLSLSEISLHNSADDCWVIVYDKVYDLSEFARSHSGGGSAIISYCGKDGTNAFMTKDKNPARKHESGDLDVLDSFYVGEFANK